MRQATDAQPAQWGKNRNGNKELSRNGRHTKPHPRPVQRSHQKHRPTAESRAEIAVLHRAATDPQKEVAEGEHIRRLSSEGDTAAHRRHPQEPQPYASQNDYDLKLFTRRITHIDFRFVHGRAVNFRLY